MKLERLSRQYLVDGSTLDAAAVINCQITVYTPPRPVYATVVHRTLSGPAILQQPVSVPYWEAEIGLFFVAHADYRDFVQNAHHPHRFTDEAGSVYVGAVEIRGIQKDLPAGAYTVHVVFRSPDGPGVTGA